MRRRVMTKRLLTRCAAAVALGMLAVPGSAPAQRIDYALQAVTPSAPARSTFPYVGSFGRGTSSGSPLVLANNVAAPQQKWLSVCYRIPGECNVEGQGPYPTFEPPPNQLPDIPPIKLMQRFSQLCLTRPNTSGNGIRPVMSPCTTAQPTHYQQMWSRYGTNPNSPSWGAPGIKQMAGSMFIAEWWQPQYTTADFTSPRHPTLRCLDITDFKNVPGTAIQLWTCTGGWNQRFRVLTVRTH
jgi:hypothetical protein